MKRRGIFLAAVDAVVAEDASYSIVAGLAERCDDLVIEIQDTARAAAAKYADLAEQYETGMYPTTSSTWAADPAGTAVLVAKFAAARNALDTLIVAMYGVEVHLAYRRAFIEAGGAERTRPAVAPNAYDATVDAIANGDRDVCDVLLAADHALEVEEDIADGEGAEAYGLAMIAARDSIRAAIATVRAARAKKEGDS